MDRLLIVDRTTTVRFLALVTLALAQTLDLGDVPVMIRRHGRAAEVNPIVHTSSIRSG